MTNRATRNWSSKPMWPGGLSLRVMRLLKAAPDGMTSTDLLAACYEGEEPPESRDEIIRAVIRRLRRRLEGSAEILTIRSGQARARYVLRQIREARG